MFKNDISKKLSLIIKAKILKNIYIFCYNYYGIALSKILIQKGYSVKGFIDNNKFTAGKKILGTKVYPPNILKTKTAYFKSNILIIISNQFERNIKNISKQLVNMGIQKKQIIYKIF